MASLFRAASFNPQSSTLNDVIQSARRWKESFFLCSFLIPIRKELKVFCCYCVWCHQCRGWRTMFPRKLPYSKAPNRPVLLESTRRRDESRRETQDDDKRNRTARRDRERETHILYNKYADIYRRRAHHDNLKEEDKKREVEKREKKEETRRRRRRSYCPPNIQALHSLLFLLSRLLFTWCDDGV